MNRRMVIDDQLYAHFVTFVCYRRRKLLSLDRPKGILLGVLNQELKRLDSTCIGFVIMPDHVHALVWFPAPGCLSRFIHEWKRNSSRLIREWYTRQNLRNFDGLEIGIRFWQSKYHSFEIWERSKLEEKLGYMHHNPVRAGLVERVTDWRWSSARIGRCPD